MSSAQPDSTRHPAESASRRKAPQLLVFCALFLVAAAAAALARNGTPPFVDILYAEDGAVFYPEARAAGLSVIVTPEGGYMHFVTRVASAAIAVLPIGQVAAAYAVIATVLVAILALYVFFASSVLLDSWPSRALLAGAMVIPPMAAETIANMTNLHWYLMFAAFWAVISNPRNAGWTVAGASVGAAAALGDPLTALLLPSAALAIYRFRSRMHGFVVAAMVAGLAVQLLVVLGAEHRVGTESSWTHLPGLYALRVASAITIGDVHLTSAWQRADWSIPLMAVVAVAVVVVLAIAWTHEWRKLIVIAAVFNSIVFFAVPLFLRGTALIFPIVGQPPTLFAGRYALIPPLFLVVCVAVLFDLAVVERTLKTALGGGIATVWLVGVIAANYFITPLPTGPSWGDGVEAARLECLSKPTGEAVVEIAPGPGWTVRLSCADL